MPLHCRTYDCHHPQIPKSWQQHIHRLQIITDANSLMSYKCKQPHEFHYTPQNRCAKTRCKIWQPQDLLHKSSNKSAMQQLYLQNAWNLPSPFFIFWISFPKMFALCSANHWRVVGDYWPASEVPTKKSEWTVKGKKLNCKCDQKHSSQPNYYL